MPIKSSYFLLVDTLGTTSVNFGLRGVRNREVKHVVFVYGVVTRTNKRGSPMMCLFPKVPLYF